MAEEKAEEKTITVKKSDLWKYSTFVLLAVVLVGAFFMIRGGPTGLTTQDDNNTKKVDLSVFLNNPDLYPSIGPENAKNVVIEFADFQCPFCAIVSGLPSWVNDYQQYSEIIGSAQKVQQLAEEGKVRFVYVSMSFLGQESIYATQAALCANEQGKFWEMHDAIFKAHDSKENNGKYSIANLTTLAKSVPGLNQATFADCLKNAKYASAVQTITTQASEVASGTPLFYVNGKQYSGSWTELSAALGVA